MQVNKKYLRLSSIGVVIIGILALRIFYLPGLAFNQSNWDDEISWMYDLTTRSPIDFIIYRDLPGYFVFTPRLIMLLGNIVPDIKTLSSLRILTIAVQVICYAAATSCIASLKSQTKIWLLIFVTLSLTYVEDLNYLHNVGYLFIFPIFLLCFKPILFKQQLPPWRLILATILVSKPITAVLILLLAVLFICSYRKYLRPLLILSACQCIYLGCYLILPNRFSTPFNTDPVTILKAAVNFPWVVFSSFNPLFSIGGMGFLEYVDQRQIVKVLGLTVYFSIILLLAKFGYRALGHLLAANLLTKSLTGLFVISYLLVYVNASDYWVKYSPLFLLDVPQHLWMRWSAILPFTAILIIASVETIKEKTKCLIYFIVSTQWLLLSIFAQPWLIRS